MVKAFGLLFVLIPILSCAQSGKKEFNQGYDYYDEGEYDKAIDSYTNAIKIDSENATYYYHRGVCRSLLSFNEDAINDLNKAISLDSAYAEAYLGKNDPPTSSLLQLIKRFDDLITLHAHINRH